MDDLISREAAVRALASSNGDYLDAFERFEKIPAVDAVLVVHGKWIRSGCVKTPQYDRTTDLPSYAHRCSACDRISYFPPDYRDSYCRRCGAKMEDEQRRAEPWNA
jgi:hypothetical protein